MANETQDIVGTLDHLAMTAISEKDVASRLTEAFEALTQNNEPPTTQLSDAMKNNLDMTKKLKLKPTKDPEEMKLADKSNRKAALGNNLDPYGFCWTHGFRVTKRHISQNYSAPVAGHQREATRKRSWEATRPGNDTMG